MEEAIVVGRNQKVLELTRQIIDLKREKKNFNASQNKMIKECEEEVKVLVREE